MARLGRFARIGGLALGLGVGAAALASAADTHTLRAVTAWPKTTYEVQNFLKFTEILKENVAKEAPGQLAIDYRGGPEVIPNQEQVEALRKGLVDMVFTTSGYYVSMVPVIDAMNLTTLTPWEERAKGVTEFLNGIHGAKANARYLGRLGPGLGFQIHLNKPIETADLKGLKIRCSPTHTAFIKRLNGAPVVIPPPDVYTSLERGVVDGYVWVEGLIRDWGWHTVTKYVVTPAVYNGVNIVLVNRDAWNKLPPNLQQVLAKSMEQGERAAMERGSAHVASEMKAYEAAGIKIIALPAPEAEKFKKAAHDALAEIMVQKSPEDAPKLIEMITKK
ncbi:MAG: TRAP transporter substrate-binding protein DctP [Deferrisomatales bacterium]